MHQVKQKKPTAETHSKWTWTNADGWALTSCREHYDTTTINSIKYTEARIYEEAIAHWEAVETHMQYEISPFTKRKPISCVLADSGKDRKTTENNSSTTYSQMKVCARVEECEPMMLTSQDKWIVRSKSAMHTHLQMTNNTQHKRSTARTGCKDSVNSQKQKQTHTLSPHS